MRFSAASPSNTAFQTFAVWLLVLALFVRGIVPVGYMPDRSAVQQGVYKLVICSGYGVKTIVFDQHKSPLPHAPDSKHEKSGGFVCPFAGLHALGLPVIAIVLTALSLWQVLRRQESPVALRSNAIGSTYARGPPLVA